MKDTKIKREIIYSNLAFSGVLIPNKYFEGLVLINDLINWDDINELLINKLKSNSFSNMSYIYTPVTLLKCLLLKKLFQINSDDDLENEINDRISFQVFVDLPSGISTPDSVLLTDFKKSIDKSTMISIYKKILLVIKENNIKIKKKKEKSKRVNQSTAKVANNKEENKSENDGDDLYEQDWRMTGETWMMV